MRISSFFASLLLCAMLVSSCSGPQQAGSVNDEQAPTVSGERAATATFSPLSPFVPADQGIGPYSRGELVNQWALWAGPLIEQATRQPTCGSLNAQGDVWFLADGFFVAAEQGACTIPAGVPIFLPVIMNQTQLKAPQVNCPKGQMREEYIHVEPTELFVIVDDFSLDNPFDYRASSLECYSLDSGVADLVSDGYWVLLKPLEPGVHLIRTGYTGEGKGVEINHRYRIRVEE